MCGQAVVWEVSVADFERCLDAWPLNLSYLLRVGGGAFCSCIIYIAQHLATIVTCIKHDDLLE